MNKDLKSMEKEIVDINERNEEGIFRDGENLKLKELETKKTKMLEPMFHQDGGTGGRGCGETHKGDVTQVPPNFRDFLGNGGWGDITYIT
jgi:hypothetical protein